MAKGRFLSKEICLDKDVNELSCADSMLGFTWLIPHLDVMGRTYGDPAIVKSFVFPRRTEITIEMMAGFIQEWHDAGLIVLYERKGERYIQFPNFDKHQKGLRKDREPKSEIPPYADDDKQALPEDIRQTSGKHPEDIPLNVKLSRSRSLSKEEVEVEANPADYGDNLLAFSKLFEELTHIKAEPDGFTELIKAGATPDHMRQAYAECMEKEMNICTPNGMIKPTLIVLGRKNSKKKNDKYDYRRYLDDGKYSKVGVNWETTEDA
jgi:hypothetical protein